MLKMTFSIPFLVGEVEEEENVEEASPTLHITQGQTQERIFFSHSFVALRVEIVMRVSKEDKIKLML